MCINKEYALLIKKYINITIMFSIYIFCIACYNSNINLGVINDMKISNNIMEYKPKIQIAKICAIYTILNEHKSYEDLTLEKLLQEAKNKTNNVNFANVGVWYKHINILYLWQKKCLILGE